MKMNIVPARQGIQWVQLGVKTFFKQPLALAGLFFMFMAAMTVLSIVPLIGNLLALALLPAASLGLMAATREAVKGKFPMPSILIAGFRTGHQQVRSMLILGAVYAVGFLLVMGASALVDGGKFAKLYLVGGSLSRETVMQPDFQGAMWVSLALYVPLSMLFWHASALVHWHGMQPMKSLFFSFYACARNFVTYVVFGLAWFGVFLLMGLAVTMLAVLLGGPTAAATVMFPAAMLVAAMFFTSIFFTFESTFGPVDPPGSEPTPGETP